MGDICSCRSLIIIICRRETRPKILWITGNKKKKDEQKESLENLVVETAAAPIPESIAATPSASYHRHHDSIGMQSG